MVILYSLSQLSLLYKAAVPGAMLLPEILITPKKNTNF